MHLLLLALGKNAPDHTLFCPILAFLSAALWDKIPNMEHILDEKDRQLLRYLQRDATLSVDALAERIHLSRNACWRRLRKLEDDGFITKRVALLDPEKLGLGLTAFVLLRAADHTPDWLSKFDTAVRRLPEICSAHRMSGDLDYVLRVRVADMSDYDRFYKSLTNLVPLRDISASFVMEDIKDTTALPL